MRRCDPVPRWYYRGKVYWENDGLEEHELRPLLDQRLTKQERRIDALRHADDAPPRRERIADTVRQFVWQRDKGRCVECGAREDLGFDHIIPLSAGGSSTERNLQLLCGSCNRRKGADLKRPVCDG